MQTRKLRLPLGDYYSLWSAFNGVRAVTGSALFSYAVALNKREIEPVITAFEESRKPSPKCVQYASEHAALVKRLAVKGENGAPVIGKDRKVAIAEPEIYASELAALRKKHEEGAKEFDEEDVRIRKMFDEVIEKKLYVVPLSQCPPGISTHLYDSLRHIIDPGGASEDTSPPVE